MNAPATRGTFLRKITPATVTGKVHGDDKWLQKLGNTRPVPAQTLYDLYGQITRAKVGTTEKGEYVQFKGRFVAVTPDGEEFASGACHVPIMEDMLFAAFQDAGGAEQKAVIEFAVRVGIVPAPEDKPSATGYVYDVQRLLDKTDASDPITRMRQEVQANALPAPGTTSADTPASAPAATPIAGHKHAGGGKRR